MNEEFFIECEFVEYISNLAFIDSVVLKKKIKQSCDYFYFYMGTQT